MHLTLEGKTALITGATSQLGRTMARTLAGSGADIALHYYRNRDMAESLAIEIRELGRRCAIVQADITRESDVMAMRDAITQSLGAPEIVVINAVAQYPWTTILDQPLEDFRGQFETCTLQSVLTAKAFLPAMTAKNAGRFIGINTECAMMNNPGSGAYAAAKRGMDGIYRVLAKEVGANGITVNQVAPGWTISDNDRQNGTQDSPEYQAKVPLNRRGTDQEIANAVLFLASDLAGFITGVYLPVCGGMVMPAI